MRTRRIDIGSVELEALEAGEDQARHLLLVHGFTGAKEDFVDHLDALAARGWHAVAPDHRGHGHSAKPAGVASYSLQTFADDMFALADALGWERFVLVGHSMGGMVAQLMAVDRPDRLLGLVLMDTSHGCPDGLVVETVELGKQVVSQGGMDLLVELQSQIQDPLATAAHLRLLAERPGYAELGPRNKRNSSPDMWLSLVDEITCGEDRLESLRSVRVPTLVMVGEQDKPFLAHSERMAKAIPDARLEVIPDAGHSPQFEAPEAWFGLLTDFIESVA